MPVSIPLNHYHFFFFSFFVVGHARTNTRWRSLKDIRPPLYDYIMVSVHLPPFSPSFDYKEERDGGKKERSVIRL